MSDYYIGEIRMFSGNYAPQDWHMCDGSALLISSYQALYSLIGTTYGGDGVTKFNLPDLRGRLPIGQGQGQGRTNRVLGQRGGENTVTLTTPNLPTHTHPFNTVATPATDKTFGPNNVLAQTASTEPHYLPDGTTGATALTTNAGTIGTTGGGQPHANTMPSLALNFIIALNGTYPTQN